MSEDKKYKKFEALNVSSKYAICGLPIRVDTYKTCSFGCKYCFSNCRKVMEFEKELAVANLKSVERRLKRIITDKNIKNGDFLDMLIAQDYTWHMGGMSDPFQPAEKKYPRKCEEARNSSKKSFSFRLKFWSRSHINRLL